MSEAPIFSPRVLLGLIAAAAAIFALSFYLAVFIGDDPEGDGDAVGPSAYSRSAIGYAGFADLLRRLDLPVVKSRSTTAKIGRNSVLVLAEPPPSLEAEENRLAWLKGKAVLFVLPKWQGDRDRRHQGWISRASPTAPSGAEWVLGLAGVSGEVVRAKPPASWPINELGVTPTFGPSAQAQLIHSSELRPVVAAEDGGILVGEAQRGGRRIWILSDPDIISNHGLLVADNASFGFDMIDVLRDGDGSIVFDETVHGFRVPTASPLQLLFKFPFVIATLQGLLAIALLLWATMRRFGAPEPAPTRLSAGKQGLIDNAALLLQFAGRRDVVLRGYVRSTLRDVARQLRAPRNLADGRLMDWLSRAAKARGVKLDGETIARRAEQPTQRTADFVAVANSIHHWKQEMLHGPQPHPRDRRGDPR